MNGSHHGANPQLPSSSNRSSMMSKQSHRSHSSLNSGMLSTRSFFDVPESVADSNEEKNNSNGIDAMYLRESRAVRTLRIVLYVGLIVTGVLLAVATCLITKANEENEFQAQFEVYASNLMDSIVNDLELKLATIDDASFDISSYARISQSTWPNVTYPEFELHGAKTNSLADTEAVFLLPVVSEDNKAGWEAYVAENQEWLDESLLFQAEFGGENTPALQSRGSISSTIQPTGTIKTGSSTYYLPLWQLAPAVSNRSIYNVDMLSVSYSLSRSLNQLLATRQAVITGAMDRQDLEQQLPGLLNNTADEGENGPFSLMLYPLFGDEPSSSQQQQLVGVFGTVYSWEKSLSKSGSHTKGPLMAVLENDCNADPEAFTFRVEDGDHAYYQGRGILLDESTSVAAAPTLYLTDNARFASVAPGAVPLDQEYCAYTVQVHATAELKQAYETNYPIIYTVVVAVVFLFTFCSFAVYNCLVERRQKIVLEQAVTSTALVSTLFPEAVRDRLLQAQAGGVGEDGEVLCGVDGEPLLGGSGSGIPPTIDPSSSGERDEDAVQNNKLSGASDRGDFSSKDCEDGIIPSPRATPKLRLKSFLRDTPAPSAPIDTAKPIADFFPHCTVLFADISGFTAWSSQREPTQVFTLLQNLYSVFDKQAKKRGVFKVETIGDSYVAVTGLPDPQPDHAVIMAKFAMECRSKMREVTKKLVRTLGPETEDLQMRFGLNSGPVTAGVLGGTAARFQLFGDTVNTAARMESTGEKNRIHLSEYTASLLVEAGKEYMVAKREGKTSVKGKGDMTTYWLEGNMSSNSAHEPTSVAVRRQSTSTYASSMLSVTTWDTSLGDFPVGATAENANYNRKQSMDTNQGQCPRPRPKLHDTKSLMWGADHEVPASAPMGSSPKLRRNASSSTARLIDWNVDTLLRLLKQVEAKRQMQRVVAEPVSQEQEEVHALRDTFSKSGSVVDEVAEIIAMPSFEAHTASSRKVNPDKIELDDDVEMQLREFVTVIASMYRDNPFHNFEHACHVQMSMIKLLERVVNPDDVDYDGEKTAVASDVHNYTYGITSDPLTQFTVVFCALIHDVDHTGVSNGQLIKEKAHIATLYKNKSVAEQNSIDLAWDLLMQDDYEDLRRCIYANVDEFMRFRQLVVNTVLATDIFDKELSALRKNRWTKAFSDEAQEEPAADHANRKATIVIEHLIQGSDVSHTMQHWEIYKKWNERLFYEMYLSFKDGRTDTDPSPGWYKGELWFFDNYVIPLAKKLKDCGVFGVCSDECLNYAMENRRMWEIHGEEVVADMLKTDYYDKLKMEKEDKRLARRRRLEYQKTADSQELNALAEAAQASKSELNVHVGEEDQEQVVLTMHSPIRRIPSRRMTTPCDQHSIKRIIVPSLSPSKQGPKAPCRRPSTTTPSDPAITAGGLVAPARRPSTTMDSGGGGGGNNNDDNV